MSKCVFFHVYIITALCLFSSTIHVNISNKGNKKVPFSRGGHQDECTFTCHLMVLFLLAQIKKGEWRNVCCCFMLPVVTTIINKVLLLLIKPPHFVFTSQTKKGHNFLFHHTGERWICSCTLSDSLYYPHRNCLSIKLCSFTD